MIYGYFLCLSRINVNFFYTYHFYNDILLQLTYIIIHYLFIYQHPIINASQEEVKVLTTAKTNKQTNKKYLFRCS